MKALRTARSLAAAPRWTRGMASASQNAVMFAGERTEPEGKRKPRILVVGCGWSGFSFLSYIDKNKYDVRVVSPANHFLFTPLLPSSVVGTLEYRAIQEPVRTVKGLGGYYQAKAVDLNAEDQTLMCEDIFNNEEFQLRFDYLVLGCGAKTNTFGIPGIAEREGKEVFFLKNLYHARQIRNRILECFERAAIHVTEPEERDRLLRFVIVGGGPTNCELMGELHDFIKNDVSKWFPDLTPHISLHLVEMGPRLLASFDPYISNVVQNRFEKRGIKVHLNVAVDNYNPETKIAHLNDGEELATELMVWSAGLRQIKFIENANEIAKGPGNKIVIDDHLKVNHAKLQDRIFAFGDCAGNPDKPLAPLAQVAAQQAKYLAKVFNAAPDNGKDPTQIVTSSTKPFKYFSLGSMVTFGQFNGAVDMTHVGETDDTKNFGFMQGIMSFFMWRSAYLLRQNSWTNRALIPMYWFKSFVLGRDISRF
eukprot:CAMPEP_0184517450 /NCGR_PEP_ID=MMETSP0198_2-20121128/5564_1 /TAXON_ID=1112570 /ORGANISM="Thraustochytrium sp., Strain LLF1b" /LENGTH=477 /DNA_ID=CAMNT_0026907829 /DNA_START=191 /DNA_END=1624 /DNA_ORIENTATION=-